MPAISALTSEAGSLSEEQLETKTQEIFLTLNYVVDRITMTGNDTGPSAMVSADTTRTTTCMQLHIEASLDSHTRILCLENAHELEIFFKVVFSKIAGVVRATHLPLLFSGDVSSTSTSSASVLGNGGVYKALLNDIFFLLLEHSGERRGADGPVTGTDIDKEATREDVIHALRPTVLLQRTGASLVKRFLICCTTMEARMANLINKARGGGSDAGDLYRCAPLVLLEAALCPFNGCLGPVNRPADRPANRTSEKTTPVDWPSSAAKTRPTREQDVLCAIRVLELLQCKARLLYLLAAKAQWFIKERIAGRDGGAVGTRICNSGSSSENNSYNSCCDAAELDWPHILSICDAQLSSLLAALLHTQAVLSKHQLQSTDAL
jgi:hypothetical protein